MGPRRRRAALALGAFLWLCKPAAGGQNDVHVGAEAQFDAEVRDVQWFGTVAEKNTLMLQTVTGKIYRSDDHGETWSELTPELSRVTGQDNDQMLRVGRLHRSLADTSTVMAFCASGPVAGLVSTDTGNTWSVVQKTVRLQSWQFHPVRATWALASHWSEGCRRDVPSALGQPCTHDLYLTKDLGRTFSLVASRVVQFSWGTRGKPGTPGFEDLKDRIYFTRFREQSGSQPRLTRWRNGIDLMMTEDLGGTFETLLPEGNKFQATNGFILAVKVIDEPGQEIRLMISKDAGKTFQESQLPHRLKHRSYTVLDTSEGAIVLHVNHGGDTGDVYISDASGHSFTLSLSGNLRKQGLCAFEKVMNLDGIYIANVVGEQEQPGSNPAATPAPAPEAAEVFEGESMGSQQDEMTIRWLSEVVEDEDDFEEAEGEAALSRLDHEYRSRGKASGVASGSALAPTSGRRAQAILDLRTVISFDKGGAWQSLAAPAGQTSCTSKNCHLHLHGFTEMFQFAPVYSYRNAVGILMGSGNVGASLSFDRSQTRTYLSRDGGWTWAEVKKGTWIYEYGNHGGLVVIADMAGKTTTAEYSFDEGHSWHEVSLGETPLDVTNVLIEPEGIARKFVLYGHRDRKGILQLLDFSKLHERACQGQDKVGTSNSDYEHWSPSDAHGGSCILGHKSIYVRRKQLSECHNQDAWEHITSTENCACTKENYECAFGFIRTLGSLDCVLDPAQHMPQCAGPLPSGTFEADAYRRVPGDTCSGGWEPTKERVSCHALTPALPTLAMPLSPAQFHPSPESSRISNSVPSQPLPSGGGGFSTGLLVCLALATVACGGAFYRSGAFFVLLNKIDDSRTMGQYAQPQQPRGPAGFGAEMVGNSAAGSSGYRPPLSV